MSLPKSSTTLVSLLQKWRISMSQKMSALLLIILAVCLLPHAEASEAQADCGPAARNLNMIFGAEKPSPGKVYITSSDCGQVQMRMKKFHDIQTYNVSFYDQSMQRIRSETYRDNRIIQNCIQNNKEFYVSYNYQVYGKTSQESELKSIDCLRECKSSATGRRNLQLATADASQSTFSINSTGSSLIAMETYEVRVTAKDSGGVPVLSGGDTFKIKIYNQAEVDGYVSLAANSSAKSVLATNIDATMIDQGDGDYTYTFTANTSGPVTISVYLEGSPGIFVEWYDNWNLVGDINHYETVSDLNYDWAHGSLPNGLSDCVSAIYHSNILFPATDTYTWSFEHDDGSIMTLGGTELFNEWDTRCDCRNQTVASYTVGDYEPLQIEYMEIIWGAFLKLFWEHGSSGNITVPASQFYHTALVSSSPYQLSVECPDGMTGDSPLNATHCIYICGDGKRLGDEICDDGNSIDGDGCSSTCDQIEVGWTCEGGSSTQPDVCTKQVGLSSDETALQVTTLFTAFSGAVISFISSALNQTSPHSTFSAINQIQLLVLLLLWKVFLPTKVVSYISSLSISMLLMNSNLGFLGLGEWVKGVFEHEQEMQDFYEAGVESSSTFMNLFVSMAFLQFMGVVHLLLIPCYKKYERARTDTKLGKIVKTFYSWMTFNFYFRYIFELFILMCLSSFCELYQNETSGGSERNSLVFAYIVAFLSLFFIIFILLNSLYRIKYPEKEFFEDELFKGLKKKPIHRLYPFLFLLRRLVLCAIVIFTRDNLPHGVFLTLFTTATILYSGYMFLARPFTSKSDSLNEMINECFYIGFCVALFIFSAENSWTEGATWIFIGCILANNVITWTISLTSLIIGIKRSKNKKDVIKVEVKPKFVRGPSAFNKKAPRAKANFKYLAEENRSNHPSTFIDRDKSNDSKSAFNDSERLDFYLVCKTK